MRLTREEAQRQTRAKLLTAAREQIARHGIAATSIRGISDAAGFTQGAFYSNFPSKEAMLLALMEEHALTQSVTFQDIVAAETGGRSEMLAAIGKWLADLEADTIWSALGIELQMHASRYPEFAAAYDASKRAHHAGFAAGLTVLFDRLNLVPRLPILQLAICANALWAGLGIEGTVAEAQPAHELMIAFLRAMIDTASPKPGPSREKELRPAGKKGRGHAASSSRTRR